MQNEKRISVLDKSNDVVKLPAANGLWETGDWVITEANAQALVGGKVYIHSAQADRSHFGGTVTGYRFAGKDTKGNKRYALQFSPEPEGRGVLCTKKWGSGQAVALW